MTAVIRRFKKQIAASLFAAITGFVAFAPCGGIATARLALRLANRGDGKANRSA